MTQRNFPRCEMCGKPLQSVDAICPACEVNLQHIETPDTSRWPTCPACEAKVPKFEHLALPEGAPWYKLTTLSFRCPSCKTALRSRYDTPAVRTARFSLLMTVLVSHHILAPAPWVWVLRFASLAAVLSMEGILWLRGYRDPIKFVPHNKR